MIAGDRCTRACGFCAVSTAKPFALEADEPQRVAEAVRRMRLKHVVITAVARDDLKDGGALHFAQTIQAVRAVDPKMVIEVLVPDFHAQGDCLKVVLDAGPEIFNHNLETVERLTPLVRSRAKYRTSLDVLARAKEISPKVVTKSGLMLGLGETENELFQAMDDLRAIGRAGAHARAVLAADAAASAGGGVHPAGDVRPLRRDRAQEGFRVRRQRAAGALQLSRGGLSSGAVAGGLRGGRVPTGRWPVLFIAGCAI